MCDLSEEEFVARVLAAQKPGAGLRPLGAQKFYILLWGLTGSFSVSLYLLRAILTFFSFGSGTVDAKYQSQPHVIEGRLAQRDPTTWTTFQVSSTSSVLSLSPPELTSSFSFTFYRYKIGSPRTPTSTQSCSVLPRYEGRLSWTLE